jgi:spoIIIJ-associated protein
MADVSALIPSEADLATARTTLETLLAKMRVTATVASTLTEPDEDGVVSIHLDVQGEDLSVLIGRKGETLTALQYITRQIVSKQVSHGISVVIDVEGYRQPMALEPMPPDERRIIHIELRDHAQVRTESVGEGQKRKVTIVPK